MFNLAFIAPSIFAGQRRRPVYKGIERRSSERRDDADRRKEPRFGDAVDRRRIQDRRR